MIVERPGNARGNVRAGWLESRHTFSFGHYHDPQWMGFGPLRVINEDRVAPGAGFPPHGHANMEILSYVLAGALAHQDNAGGGGVLRPGELQWMGAGHGVEHSEFNASQDQPVHFLQVWIQPDRVNAPPAYAQRAFDPAARRGRWATLASPDGSDGSLAIRQQAWLRGTLLGAGESVEWVPDPARRYWLHVAQGAVELDGRVLAAGDALGFFGESDPRTLAARGDGVADVLLFDLPA
ncbi:pirin family protein [Luteimonas sp. 50]|uniref:Pirin family protein n=1 Tax=Cognatiluteimonas sedimenti TaxID=2927791 RepID=A0ABT0A3Q2_9GAMM|nr:pirin family protein [Lysobacter sedimenti]MCJ0825604.1 pirin family protein [Lysobacter sedimenti]